MPATIVTETCPAPTCNLTPRDLQLVPTALHVYWRVFAPGFRRTEQADWGACYLRGLLSDLPRKSIEPMALALDVKVRAMQAFLSESPWATAPILTAHQQLVAQTLGEADGVLVVDESGMPKQGQHSVGVAPQYCGALGKVANCQVGVYLGYASRKGYTLLDSQLYVPPTWFDEAHAPARQACGLPPNQPFATKPTLALTLLRRVVDHQVIPARWVVADALYGDTPAFRDGVAGLGLAYLTEIACSTLIWRRQPAVLLPPYRGKGPRPRLHQLKTPWQQPYRVDDVPKRLPKAAWTQVTIKEGSKGPLVCEVALLRVTEARQGRPGPRVWLILRRNLSSGEVKYYLSNADEATEQVELVRLLGMRWPIETMFEESKGALGMDHYETRSWQGWHHHMLLVMLAHHFLVWLRCCWLERAPALTLYQVRLLVLSTLPLPNWGPAQALLVVHYYQQRNHAAYLSHRKRKLTQLGLTDSGLSAQQTR